MPDIITRKPSAVLTDVPIPGLLADESLPSISSKPAKLDREQHSSHDVIVRRCFPNLALTTQDGKQVQLYDDLIKNKIVLINFMYTSCNHVCPRITQNLLKVQQLFGRRMGEDIFIYSLTLDPHHDTPEVLKRYAQMHQVGRGWSFLTGSSQDLELLRRRLGFTNLDPTLDQIKENHVGNVRYGNEGRQLWSACPGMSHPEFIFKAISWVDWPTQQGDARPLWAQPA